MRAISLWEPWASAIALELKHIETRGWSTSYRGKLAIHAAIRWGKEQRDFLAECRATGMIPPTRNMNLGHIVAVVTLSEIVPTEILLASGKVSRQEHLFGNYGLGRYGWLLEDIKALPNPVPFTGRQRFFNVPDYMLRGY